MDPTGSMHWTRVNRALKVDQRRECANRRPRARAPSFGTSVAATRGSRSTPRLRVASPGRNDREEVIEMDGTNGETMKAEAVEMGPDRLMPGQPMEQRAPSREASALQALDARTAGPQAAGPGTPALQAATPRTPAK